MRCRYEYETGTNCDRDVLANSESGLCLLHDDLDTKNREETRAEFYREIKEGVRIFEGCILPDIRLSGTDFGGDLNFQGAIIDGDADFDKVLIKGNFSFGKATINGQLRFCGTISGNALFAGLKISANCNFEKAKIGGSAIFSDISDKSKMRNILFSEVELGGDVNFYGAEIGGDIIFSEVKTAKSAGFQQTKIVGDVRFEGVEIGNRNNCLAQPDIKANIHLHKPLYKKLPLSSQDVSFYGAEIRREIWFEKATTIHGSILLDSATIEGNCTFSEVRVDKDVVLNSTKVGRNVVFDEVDIGRDVLFHGHPTEELPMKKAVVAARKAEISGNVCFRGVKLAGDARLSEAEIRGKLLLRKIDFRQLGAQEGAYRKARRIFEDLGDRIEADRHFYFEMEAKRKQKNTAIRFLELPIQYVFGYGVHPRRIIVTSLLVILCFAFAFWLGNGLGSPVSLWKYLYFSTVTAFAPGRSVYSPGNDIYRVLASIEAVSGTFMWAAFIATFARKYMR